MAAVEELKSAARADQPVVMVCEVQAILRPYLEARKKMHFLYKVARADSSEHLAQQFAVVEKVKGRTESATWLTEEKRMVEKRRVKVAKGGKLVLYHACSGGFAAAVSVALEMEGVDVNATNSDGRTGLFAASRDGHSDVVELLLGVEGINVNQADEDGTTALYFASLQGHLDVVKLLLGAEGININQANNSGSTALYMASQLGHSDVVKLLLGAEGINVNQAKNTGSTALFMALQFGHSDVVKLLLASSDIDVNKPMTNGATPLIIASYLGHASCVFLLLKNPAINPTLLFQDSTALQLAQPSARADGWEFLENRINVEGRANVVQLLVDAAQE